MRVAGVLAVLVLLLSACHPQHSSKQPPPLQKLQRLSGALSRAGYASSWAASAFARLGHVLPRDNPARTRRSAVQLRHNAVLLQRFSGRAAYGLRRIRPLVSNPHVKQFVHSLLATLNADWSEGRALQRLAGVAWWDPMIVDGRHQREWYAYMHWARHQAAGAVFWSRRAAQIRRRFPTAFRYHPMKVAGQHRHPLIPGL